MMLKTPRAMGAMFVALGVAFTQPARASDALIEGARQCTQYFPTAEKRFGIPGHLLAAISSTESGRWHNGLGIAVPWPWTINVEGQGHYFNSKAEAIAKTSALMRQGYRSIDVGCMQVNLKHHPNAFRSLNDAFDPEQNVNYAAKFLRENYADLGDWVKATAAYHSRTPHRGSKYLGLIERNWNRIVAKVQQARSRVGAEPLASAAPAFEKTRSQLAREASLSPAPAAPRTASAHGVKVVSVKDAPKKRADVLIIQPKEMTIKVANAAPVQETGPVIVRPTPDSVKRVTAEDALRNREPQAADRTFVFAN